jgi:hypothetical protein
MSQQYDNTNRGVLFENDRKTTDKHPDLTGTINIDGVEKYLSGWWKEGKNGQFLSVSIGKPKEQQAPQRAAPPVRTMPQRPGQRRQDERSGGGGDIDDIPFSDPLRGRKGLAL